MKCSENTSLQNLPFLLDREDLEEERTLRVFDNYRDMCIPVFCLALINLGNEKGLCMRQTARPWSGASFSLEVL